MTSCNKTTEDCSSPKETKLFTVGYLLYDDMDAFDICSVCEIFGNFLKKPSGDSSFGDLKQYFLAKSIEGPITCANTLKIKPDTKLADAPAKFDILMVFGGPGRGFNTQMVNRETIEFIKSRGKASDRVIGISNGALLLGAAGLLEGKKATTHWASLDFLTELGAEAVPAKETRNDSKTEYPRYVRDGNIVTSAGITAAIDTAIAFLAQERGETVAQTCTLAYQYDPQPPKNIGGSVMGNPNTCPPELLAATMKTLAPSLEKTAVAVKIAASRMVMPDKTASDQKEKDLIGEITTNDTQCSSGGRQQQAPFRIGFVLFEGLTQLDFLSPFETFSLIPTVQPETKIEFHVIAPNSYPTITADCGLAIVCTDSFDSCPQMDMILMPGGVPPQAPKPLNDSTQAFILKQAPGCKYVTSVCTGGMTLAATGLMEGREMATHWGVLKYLPQLKAKPLSPSVRYHINEGTPFITGGGVTCGLDFGIEVVKVLTASVSAAQQVQLMLQYAPVPPYPEYGNPETCPPEFLKQFESSGSGGPDYWQIAVDEAKKRLFPSEE